MISLNTHSLQSSVHSEGISYGEISIECIAFLCAQIFGFDREELIASKRSEWIDEREKKPREKWANRHI